MMLLFIGRDLNFVRYCKVKRTWFSAKKQLKDIKKLSKQKFFHASRSIHQIDNIGWMLNNLIEFNEWCVVTVDI